MKKSLIVPDNSNGTHVRTVTQPLHLLHQSKYYNFYCDDFHTQLFCSLKILDITSNF